MESAISILIPEKCTLILVPIATITWTSRQNFVRSIWEPPEIHFDPSEILSIRTRDQFVTRADLLSNDSPRINRVSRFISISIAIYFSVRFNLYLSHSPSRMQKINFNTQDLRENERVYIFSVHFLFLKILQLYPQFILIGSDACALLPSYEIFFLSPISFPANLSGTRCPRVTRVQITRRKA